MSWLICECKNIADNLRPYSISLMKFYAPVNVNVANLFDNYDKKLYEPFWLSKTDVKYLIDQITVQQSTTQASVPRYFI